MKKAIIIPFLLCNIFVYGQTGFNSEGFKATHNDLLTNTYEKDSTANALILYDYGKSYVDKEEYDLRTEIKSKIKIINREGFDKASVSIHLYNNKKSKEKVKNIVAETYNLIDGVIIKTRLKKADIFEEKYDENHTLVKFTLPNIKEGSVITYSYTLVSPFMFKYQGWRFQHDIPTLYSEYNASIPGNWVYNIKLVGGKKLIKNESVIKKKCLYGPNGGSANCSNSIYAMKDIPAFIEENYMTAKENYLARIDYELKTFTQFDGSTRHFTKSWDDTDKEFRRDKEIGKQLKKSVDANKLLPTDILSESNTLNKAKAIFKHMQDNYTWNDEYRIFTDVSVKDLIKNKSGNVSSINILLHNLLNESDVDAKPVLLSTRNNGFPTKVYPVISDFNYIIVQATIDNKTYLLDATDKFISFGDLPFRCLNSYARLMDFKNGSNWIDIKPQTPTTLQYKADLKIDENETISGRINVKTTGYHALRTKKEYYSNTESYVDNLEDEYPNIEISNYEAKEESITSSQFIESYDILFDSDETGNNIYLNPFFSKFIKENPFKLQDRTYPIDFGYKNTFIYILKLEFGDNYTVEEKPKDLNLGIPNNKGQVLFTSAIQENFIQLILRVKLKDALYAPQYYPYLKKFMAKIVDIQTNSLLLLKKK